MSFYKKAQEQLRTITSADERIKKLQKEMKTQQDLVNRLSKNLSDRRMEAGKEFVAQVEAELTFLDMPAVRLLVQNDIHLPDGDGIDRIAFLISANQGEQPKPMARIASGGELSRIMLAVKNVMWSRDDAGTMIFDEVDAGVSGRAAQKIGRKLSQAARSRQVICVTHLAQIASCGDSHMLIRKEAVEGQTYTRVSALEGQHRLEELARIISGENITDASLRTAREMVDTAQAERNKMENGICLGELPQTKKDSISA
jgi:DNA repair protein RecN (Recombination protein N)